MYSVFPNNKSVDNNPFGLYRFQEAWEKLEFEDILHYQKIIVALTETDTLMKEVDEVGA
jgi:hypothetical protein